MRVVFAVAVLLFSALALANEFENKTEEEYVKTNDLCFKEQNLPQSYKAKFEDFEYPDEPIVYEYLRCVWLKMGLWDDANGFSVEHIADLYKDKAKTEELIPALSACNQNADQDPALKWLYRGYKCILETRVGGWFKEDVKNYVSKQ